MRTKKEEWIYRYTEEFIRNITDNREIVLTKIMLARIFNQGSLTPRILRCIRKRGIKTASDFINMELMRDKNVGEITLFHMAH